jgi:phenylacetate-CoA ligase
VYPSAVEGVVRRYSEIREFRIVLTRVKAIDEIILEVEPNVGVEEKVARDLVERLRMDLADAHEGLRFEVHLVAADTLPVFELKARRLVDRREEATS